MALSVHMHTPTQSVEGWRNGAITSGTPHQDLHESVSRLYQAGMVHYYKVFGLFCRYISFREDGLGTDLDLGIWKGIRSVCNVVDRLNSSVHNQSTAFHATQLYFAPLITFPVQTFPKLRGELWKRRGHSSRSVHMKLEFSFYPQIRYVFCTIEQPAHWMWM